MANGEIKFFFNIFHRTGVASSLLGRFSLLWLLSLRSLLLYLLLLPLPFLSLLPVYLHLLLPPLLWTS